ncbi:MAG: YjzC family protein [Desulfobulbaceae bacterium]|nr:YjzC family protein [Desulfobulbaceae bacterium]
MGVKHKPGENPSRPGEYIERGPRGGNVTKGRQVTIEPGDKPMPPTSKPGNIWERIGPPKKS